MEPKGKTRAQLLSEVEELRRRIARLEASAREHKKTEEELRASETALRNIIVRNADGIIIVNQEGVVLFANPAAAALLGRSIDELVGKLFGYPIVVGETANLEIIPEKGPPRVAELRVVEIQWEGQDAYLASLRDISPRKRVEEALRESEHRFRELFDHMSNGVILYEADDNGRDFIITDLNQAGERISRVKREEVLGRKVLDVFPGIKDLGLFDMLQQVWKTGEPRHHPPAKYVDRRVASWLENYVYKLPSGEVVAVYDDVTERVQAEEALRESEEKYRTILESMQEGYYEVDLSGKFTFFNDAMCRMIGYSRDEFLGLSYRDYTTPETAEQTYQIFNQVYETGKPAQSLDHEIITRDGQKRVHEVSASLRRDSSGRRIGFRGIVRDITERKQAEEMIRTSNLFLEIANRYRKLEPILEEFVAHVKEFLGCSAVGIRLLDEEGHIPYKAHDGFSQEYLAQESPLSICTDKCMCVRVLKGETDLKLPCFTKDGSFHLNATTEDLATVPEKEKASIRGLGGQFGYKSVALVPIRMGSHILGLIHVADQKENMVPLEKVEILEGVAKQLGTAILRVRAEEALSQSEERYRSLVENTLDGYFISEFSSGRFLFVNHRLCDLLGYTRPQLSELSVWDVTAPEDHERILEWGQSQPEGEILRPESLVLTALHRDGSTFRAEVSASRVTFRGTSVFQGVVRDVTEKERLQQQLLGAQKMEAIGLLAGGVAHDLNNLLQPIQGFTELLLLDREENQIGHEELQEISRATKRATELTQQLLAFSRKAESSPRPININQQIKQIQKLLVRTIPKMILIELYLDDGLRIINADPAQMEQVLMNLGVNAKEAMPEGGRLTIATENVTLDEEYCQVHQGALPGDYVLVTVSDTGCGMDKETVDHIFEPFFTTKDMGQGTGLGLAMVYGIVKSHRGYIMCYSEPGQGTTFKIYLPAMEGEAEPENKEQKESPAGGTETILLVDDEEQVRNLGQQVLPKYGYTVQTSPDGETALAIYRQDRDKIDLVILDLVMPGLDGWKCLEELLRIDPQARVIVASGFSLDRRPPGASESGAKDIIRKPYEIRQMLQVVRRVLDQA